MQVGQDHLGLVVVGVAGVVQQSPVDLMQDVADVDVSPAARQSGDGWQGCEELPHDQDVDEQFSGQYGHGWAGGDPADDGLVLLHRWRG